eukprot:TRINITY_DN76075_c0_g1_i1.p1 TRINITY_DN76075_c0_g1~~TRINITY_DN76075_c0_g1_i1.p1  ORF type:complete len:425 (+),score=56.85 TRINITY_DN76075_c0_g1_i1:51-1325(+)
MVTAQQLLREELGKFDLFKALPTGVREELVSVAEQEHREAGDLLFQQGDPPGACYLVVSGEVGVFVGKGRSATVVNIVPQSPVARGRVRRPTTAMALADSALQSGSLDSEEGQESALDSVAGPGKVVGLLAQMENAPRTASARCNQDCTFVVIGHSDFSRLVRDTLFSDIVEKQSFLESHLPGLHEFAESFVSVTGKSHPSYMFAKQRYCSGFVFHNEGSTVEGALYIVFGGSVEFHRVAQSSNPPGPPVRKQLGSLLCGGLFSSMPVVTGSSHPEPFTVIAGSHGCEVYRCAGENLQKLPSKVLAPARTQLARSAKLRLDRFSSMLASEEAKAREGLRQVRLDKAKTVTERLNSGKHTVTWTQQSSLVANVQSLRKLPRPQSCGRGMPSPQKQKDTKASRMRRGKAIIHDIGSMPQLRPKLAM